LQPCLFHLGDSLIEANQRVDYVYFLKSGLISLVMDAVDGINVEIGMIGFEGLVGAGEALTAVPMVSRAQVQIAGSGWRLPTETLRQVYKSNGALQEVLLRFQQTLAAQAAQCAFCNRRHSIEQRLSRWLLMAQDRSRDNNLELTHEFMATMLGTRRAAVSIAANQLRSDGLIEYKRGKVAVLDREGLEKAACECFAPLHAQFKLLLHRDA
jgi:CRP-like cAMP-binding protein